MHRTTVTIGADTFRLHPDQDTQMLKEQAVDTITSGGGLMEFETPQGVKVGVVLSSGVAVVFRTSEIQDGDDNIGDTTEPPDLAWIEFEM